MRKSKKTMDSKSENILHKNKQTPESGIKSPRQDKKILILTWAAVITLALFTIGGAYAYFTAQTGDGSEADISASTGTTDSLSFDVGDAINIKANADNFAQGKGSLKDDTTASAILKANNTTNEAKAKYNIFFIIDKNDFTYTT
ncbi:MAG: hypothetical protein K2M17_02545 [Bacilli bacterium]|nr:hypothetical protein [Bacilli bacterium]